MKTSKLKYIVLKMLILIVNTTQCSQNLDLSQAIKTGDLAVVRSVIEDVKQYEEKGPLGYWTHDIIKRLKSKKGQTEAFVGGLACGLLTAETLSLTNFHHDLAMEKTKSTFQTVAEELKEPLSKLKTDNMSQALSNTTYSIIKGTTLGFVITAGVFGFACLATGPACGIAVKTVVPLYKFWIFSYGTKTVLVPVATATLTKIGVTGLAAGGLTGGLVGKTKANNENSEKMLKKAQQIIENMIQSSYNTSTTLIKASNIITPFSLWDQWPHIVFGTIAGGISTLAIRSGANTWYRSEDMKSLMQCLNTTDKGKPPLHLAIELEDEEKAMKIVYYLLKHKQIKEQIKQQVNGEYPIHIAAKKGHKPIVAQLLCKEADPNVLSVQDRYTPLHLAAQGGHTSVIKILTRYTGIDSQDYLGNTALHHAIASKDRESVVALLHPSSGSSAKPNVPDHQGISPLMKAVRQESYQITRELLNINADPDTPDSQGITPLMEAVRKGNSNIVKELLLVYSPQHPLHFKKVGANPNIGNLQGITPLMEASRQGNRDIVEYLLHANAQVNATDDARKTALHHVLSTNPEGIESIVRLLLDNGATKDTQAKELALHIPNPGIVIQGLLQ